MVASLWDVGDESAAAFMEQFYYWLGEGRSVSDALRSTKLAMASSAAWSAPSDWAAFVVIGSTLQLEASRVRGKGFLYAAITAATVLVIAALALLRGRPERSARPGSAPPERRSD